MKNKDYRSGSRRRLAVMVALLVVLAAPVLHAQDPAPVPVEISKQKIASEGKVYYMHQVLKGQTLYSISKAYNVSVDQVARENALQANGIREGQVLRIPASAASQPSTVGQPASQGANTGTPTPARTGTTVPAKPLTQDERYLYHKVLKGETLATVAGSTASLSGI